MQEQLSTAQKLMNTMIEFFVNYSFQVLGAVIILIAGGMIAGWVAKIVLNLLEKKKVDITLAKFLVGIVKGVVFGFAILIALGKFGITIAPFIAALSALTFGASFAIQGPLSNYGAGLSIIMSRPFVVGDTVTVAGVSGVVHEVKLPCTVLTDEDGVKITIPSKDIVGKILYNSRQYKVVESGVGISYDNDPEQAVQTIRKTLQQFREVSQEPKAQIGINTFEPSSINIGYRYWVPTAKYFETLHTVNLAVYKALQQAKIKIPYPQQEVRILSQQPV